MISKRACTMYNQFGVGSVIGGLSSMTLFLSFSHPEHGASRRVVVWTVGLSPWHGFFMNVVKIIFISVCLFAFREGPQPP